MFQALGEDELAALDSLFITDLTTLRTLWNELRPMLPIPRRRICAIWSLATDG
ncbi:MAG: hypothetical protein LC797_24220 [Chloroflexi bacterium]|nr:hypothetical protein [Chloroflexota bacterium]